MTETLSFLGLSGVLAGLSVYRGLTDVVTFRLIKGCLVKYRMLAPGGGGG